MNIKHEPLFDVTKIVEIYSKKDGVPVIYVGTTDLKYSDTPMDIFYRETPHPDFGNKYFGIFVHPITRQTMITDADYIEELDFALCENDAGQLEYSQSHHDYKSFNNGNSIDGGREYARGWGYNFFKVKDGEFVAV